MELSVGERLVLLSVLPIEGDFTTLKVLRDAVSIIGLNDEELKKADIEKVEDGLKISIQNNFETDITLGEMATHIIVEELKKLNEQKKLMMEHYPLYEKFVEK